MSRTYRMRFEMAGWILFTLSALFFTLSSLRSGDVAGLLGSLLFLVACGFFMVPRVRRALGRRFPDRAAGCHESGE